MHEECVRVCMCFVIQVGAAYHPAISGFYRDPLPFVCLRAHS